MIPAPLPPDEAVRLERLYELDVLDTAADPALDDLVQRAAIVTHSQIALVTLLDADRQWFKAAHGITGHGTPRDVAFCAYTILGRDLFEVADTLEDERFHDNPFVTGAPFVRSYAAMPLVVAGQPIGALCVIDPQARRLSPLERGALRELGLEASRWFCDRFQARGTWQASSFDPMRSWERAERAATTGLRLSLKQS